jgi:hypothetical protein
MLNKMLHLMGSAIHCKNASKNFQKTTSSKLTLDSDLMLCLNFQLKRIKNNDF